MKILIVDDELTARLSIIQQLDKKFYVIQAVSFDDAVSKLEHHKFDICYIDLKLDQSPDFLGLKLIPKAIERGFYTVVMTSVDDDSITEAAYALGCQDMYIKGNEESNIAETLNKFLLSRDSFVEDHLIKDIVRTQNKKYKEELKRLLKFIPTDIPLCLRGESGTGKSHLARAIHDISKRKGNFVEVNCATFGGDTLMSALFGHVKGSFTGASADTQGKLSHAHQGTLFLDEIGSMSLDMQEALLKAIEEKSYYPVGSNKLVKSDFRVICATLDDLETLIKAGKFRFDLFQRISGYTFTMAPLRDRLEDIPSIIKSSLHGSRKVIFKEDAKRMLESYSWPGNIRELMRFAELISYAGIGVIKADDVKDFMHNSIDKNKTSILDPNQYQLVKELGLKGFLELLTAEIVKFAVTKNDDSPVKAINELKISSSTFYKYHGRAGISI